MAEQPGSEVFTEEQKHELEQLQLFKNKEGNVSIEVNTLTFSKPMN